MSLLTMADFALFILAASLGALLRFACSTFVEQAKLAICNNHHLQYIFNKKSPFLTSSFISCFSVFPLGLFIVNMLGCLGFGIVISISQNILPFTQTEEIIILTGFFGSFTSFSTYIFEIYLLWQKKYFLPCIFFCFGQILLGISFTYLGINIFS